MPVDHRFFAPKGALDLEAVAKLTGARELRDENKTVVISGVAASGMAMSGEACFFEGKPSGASSVSSEASACFVTDQAAQHLPVSVVALIVDMPRYALSRLGSALFRYPSWPACDQNVKDSSIAEEAVLASGVSVSPGAAIGAGTNIGPNSAIGPGVQIGRDCKIGANVSIQCALIGDNVTILSGARIGEAGFGVMPGPSGPVDVPQYGRVIIQDHVTVGANSTIDRGAFDDTVIGEYSKIDNLCQIAHNVVLGRGVMIAAFGGVSGSVMIDDGAMLGGRVDVADHVHVGKAAQLAASAGVFRNVPDGETWGGTPAKPIRQWMRETAWLQKQTAPKKKS